MTICLDCRLPFEKYAIKCLLLRQAFQKAYIFKWGYRYILRNPISSFIFLPTSMSYFAICSKTFLSLSPSSSFLLSVLPGHNRSLVYIYSICFLYELQSFLDYLMEMIGFCCWLNFHQVNLSLGTCSHPLLSSNPLFQGCSYHLLMQRLFRFIITRSFPQNCPNSWSLLIPWRLYHPVR